MINCPCHPERSEGSHHDTPNRCFVPQHDKQNNRNMKKYYYILLFTITTILLGACSSNDIPDGEVPNDKNTIEIGISSKNYTIHKTSTKLAMVRATDAGTDEEQKVENIYLFLFDNSGANAVKYYINSATFTGGTWSEADKKVTLAMTQAAAGERQVYVVANCADIQTALSGVTTVTQLQAVLKETAQPWSDNIKTPILMSGGATHNFVNNRVLSAVHLERAVAKVELKVKLQDAFQSVVTDNSGKTPEYRYRYVDFDKNTYVINPGSKTDALATSDWTDWTYADVTVVEGKATDLKLTTYLNERFTTGAKIEIQMFYNDGGLLPPPEFGFETYTLPLPDEVVRNTWYKYDIEI